MQRYRWGLGFQDRSEMFAAFFLVKRIELAHRHSQRSRAIGACKIDDIGPRVFKHWFYHVLVDGRAAADQNDDETSDDPSLEETATPRYSSASDQDDEHEDADDERARRSAGLGDAVS